MAGVKLFFISNMRFLRERKKLTQTELAEVFGLKRARVNAWEAGTTENPPLLLILQISEYFKISVDSLLKVDLSRLSELKLRELEAGNDHYMTGTNLRVLTISVDSADKENIEYVPVKAKAGYRAGYADPDYIASLPKFSLPNLPPTGTFRMFPTMGDSMLPLPEGSDVIGQFVEDWKTIKPGTLCILILKAEQDFVFKKVTLRPESRTLYLESLNLAYQPYEVAAGDVLEIWKYHSYQSQQVPEPTMDVQHISSTVREILGRLKLIEDKIDG